MKKLWYNKPANVFEEALPLGNGRIGAMFYGQPIVDKISLNEDTLWSGFPKDKSPTDAYLGIEESKRAVKNGDYKAAESIIWEKCLGDWTESYQPAGELHIRCEDGNEYTDYYRELNLENAIATSRYCINGNKYCKEVFCSSVDNLLIVHFFTESKESTTVIELESVHPFELSHGNNFYSMKSQAPSYAAPSYYACEEPIGYDELENNRALSYTVAIRPLLFNGLTVFKDNKIYINSTNYCLLLDISTNFEGYDKQPINSKINTFDLCYNRLTNALKRGFKKIRQEHCKDYSDLFNRMEISLEGMDRSDWPTDERIKAYKTDGADHGLPVLLFDFGRYLTISASRENTQAMNLQGIWNEKVRAPWSSNYTLNINTQMNYWHVERTNLSECHLPLVRLIEELAENGKITAQNNYHCSGWCSHHNTDLWRQSEPVGASSKTSPICYGFWNMSGGWLARHIWEHYEYTGDIKFLRTYWGIMKGAAEFIKDWLVLNEDGKYTTPITTSPENNYYTEAGDSCSLSVTSAMDIGIICDLFESCIRAGRELNCDAVFAEELSTILSSLENYKIGSKGQILEWNKEVDEIDLHHRHLSLLYGLYPGQSMSQETAELTDAAKTTMEIRGDDSTGWGLCWRINIWARLKNGERAKQCVDHMLRFVGQDSGYFYGGGIYANLFAAHPPFQIDANFGFAAGILEMLVQEYNGDVILLPALPEAWKKGGTVRGLRLKGNKTIDFQWKDGQVCFKTITQL